MLSDTFAKRDERQRHYTQIVPVDVTEVTEL